MCTGGWEVQEGGGKRGNREREGGEEESRKREGVNCLLCIPSHTQISHTCNNKK